MQLKQGRGSYAVDEFERRRRVLETRNEILVRWVLAALLSVALIASLMNQFVRWAPFPTPPLLVLALAVSMVVCVGVSRYLRRGPPYHLLRKYILTGLDFGVCVCLYGLLIDVLPPLLLGSVPAVAGMVLTVLSGLRYSTFTVVFAGTLAFWLHIASNAFFAPADFRLTMALTGGFALLTSTTAITYVVASLIRLHRESIRKEHLSRFLAPELIEQIARDPDLLERKTENRIATVLFVDIRGFTRLSERMEPADLVDLLNLFFDEMTGAILNHRGMIDKYIGDAVMGVFGVPIGGSDHAVLAVKTAREMRARISGLNLTLERSGRSPIAVGIGIHTGPVVAGAIGSKQRLEYTVVGDTVNVANRLASLTQEYGVEILVSGTTCADLGGSMPVREIGTVAVRGREQPLTLWTPAS